MSKQKQTNRKNNEAQMVKALLGGSKQVFRKFYRDTKPILLGWLQKQVAAREDAEEILHDIYISFLDSLPLFQGSSSLITFLFSIARHEIADYWRKRYAKKAILTIPFVDQVYNEKLYSASQTKQVVEQVYEKLLPEQRRILTLKYEQGFSVAEIAQRLSLSVKAAESRLFRARQAFQVAYAKVDID